MATFRSRQPSIKADMNIDEHEFNLEAPDSHQVNQYQKSQTKYKVIFDKVKELIRDDPNIQKEGTTPPLSISSIPSDIRQFKVPASDYSDLSLPKVGRETYTRLLLDAFNELNIKWMAVDKIWIKNYRKYGTELSLDRSTNFIKIWPKKQIGKKGSLPLATFLEENKKLKEDADDIAAIPTIASTTSFAAPPLKKQKESKSRDYGLGYSTTIIVAKKPSAQKYSYFVVDNTQNAVYDFWKWKAQSQDYGNKIEEPGPIGYITGNNMPEPLFKWKKDRDKSYLDGETQRDLNGIQTDRQNGRGEYIEIGGLFYYFLKTGYNLEFFPEPEPEEISLKKITYNKSKKGNKNRKSKTYLKSSTPNEDGSFDIYTDEAADKARKIGEMDPDDGIIAFDEYGIDSEDDENNSMNYPHEIVTLYQEDPKTIKKNEALSQANKELVELNLAGFYGAGWTVSWDSSLNNRKGGLLFERKDWFINAEDRTEGDHVTERYMDDVRLYDTTDDGYGIVNKKLDKFLTDEDKEAGWNAAFSNSKYKTYYYKQGEKSVWQYKDITYDGQDLGMVTGQITGGKRKTKRKTNRRNRRNRTFKKR